MSLQSLDLRRTGQFPAFLLDYLDGKTELKEFYSIYPTLENAKEAILRKKDFDPEKRKTLVDVLTRQYKGLPDLPDFSALLDENTFTVTTGHQLNIFTGPLYVVYKIVTTINLAQALKKAYPEYNFVPVYWMASEDHDFEEIASFHLFGQTHKWAGEHKGAVGRLDPRELESIIKQLPSKPLLFAKAYLENSTLADAARCYMHELFGQYGLISVDADHTDLKRHFLRVIKDELTQSSSEKIFTETAAKLEKLGYDPGLHVREINLFYLDTNLRERIVKEDGIYKVLNTELTFTEEEILDLAEKSPEMFSPNVILRPLYEEIILPNLAYIGGPSELPYWMSLKGIFDYHNVPYPMLIPRNFAMYVTNEQVKKAKKLKVDWEELFKDEFSLRRNYVLQNTTNKLSLQFQKDAFRKIMDEIVAQAVQVDPTMKGAVEAEHTRLCNSLQKLEKRIIKAEEHNQESNISQLLNLKNKLFPGRSAQERYDNFLNFYINDPEFIQKLFRAFDPLDFRYNILLEE
ncbi:bacillithiol biosynthesis cysteine-adding enzyme BshC [Dyadobacter sediminis]|uniref:Putative cysteine ligase BshC n=1 Tax=Dyadobacter sediminis TaxID=1493691 RepID=A0A5R9K7W8_9BACT|nr:bacillithiol biosynthesis cysteine-adding enzyme BshC [Dyadobacter sediminis]TLU89961.1 bacillithiol biosynthesis cysteine-adding enzyme BshC [Dyadobacter sediminis]GGC11423.1 putative cysteine ligase BshC [Dyadobacter sediminis]